MIQKFLARFVLAGQNQFESLKAVTGGQVLPEKLPEFMGLIPGEKWNLAQQALELGRYEWAVVAVLVIGQVAASGKPDRPIRESSAAVFQILLVLQGLLRRVQQVPRRLPHEGDNAILDGAGFRVCPLL